jgi:hypothetical protein
MCCIIIASLVWSSETIKRIERKDNLVSSKYHRRRKIVDVFRYAIT